MGIYAGQYLTRAPDLNRGRNYRKVDSRRSRKGANEMEVDRLTTWLFVACAAAALLPLAMVAFIKIAE